MRSCGGARKGCTVITDTHAFPSDSSATENTVATAEWSVSIIRHHEEGKQLFSSVDGPVT